MRWVPIPDRGGCGSPSQTPPPQQSPLTLFSPYQQSDCPGQGVPQGAQEALHHVSQIHQRSFGSSAAHLRVCGEKWGSESCPHWELCLHGPPHPIPRAASCCRALGSHPWEGRGGCRSIAYPLTEHKRSPRRVLCRIGMLRVFLYVGPPAPLIPTQPPPPLPCPTAGVSLTGTANGRDTESPTPAWGRPTPLVGQTPLKGHPAPWGSCPTHSPQPGSRPAPPAAALRTASSSPRSSGGDRSPRMSPGSLLPLMKATGTNNPRGWGGGKALSPGTEPVWD